MYEHNIICFLLSQLWINTPKRSYMDFEEIKCKGGMGIKPDYFLPHYESHIVLQYHYLNAYM